MKWKSGALFPAPCRATNDSIIFSNRSSRSSTDLSDLSSAPTRAGRGGRGGLKSFWAIASDGGAGRTAIEGAVGGTGAGPGDAIGAIIVKECPAR
ncbi:MAG TPA: hypothetical protein VN794_03960, partial [Methylomirabilota bacterium]|nr:hypothetical protein [Methylomirabilota bacterium]